MPPRPPPTLRFRSRSGSAALTAALWLLAGALFVLPFLRRRDHIDLSVRHEGRSEKDVAFDAALAEAETSLELGLAGPIAAASEQWFGQRSASLAHSGVVEIGRLAAGREVYDAQCVGCHGANGDGAGPAATLLAPRPRNFRKGVFKFTSVESGGRPLRRDLQRTITYGLAGSAMPDFRLLSEEHRKDLVEYVRWIALRGEFEELMLQVAVDEEELPDAAEIAEIVIGRWDETRQKILRPTSPEPAEDHASIARGQALFVDAKRANCAACHGPTGKGDGPTANDYLDDWGYPIRPRDFTAGVFRSGSDGADLWVTIAGGIKGTPMAGFAGTSTSDEIWDLVHFVRSLARPAGGTAAETR